MDNGLVFTDTSFNKVKKYISNLCANNNSVNYVFNRLEKIGDVIIVGGAIRDIGVLDRDPRDIDIIVDTTDNVTLENILMQFNYSKNRFGGYKLLLETIELDIWSIDNNWAFKNKYLDTKADKIKDGIFYNIDSILMNITKDYYEAHYFNDAVRNKILDIILDQEIINENPSKSTNILRAFLLKDKYKLDFSDKLEHYIYDWAKYTANPYYEIEKAYEKHYRKKCQMELFNELKFYCDNKKFKLQYEGKIEISN